MNEKSDYSNDWNVAAQKAVVFMHEQHIEPTAQNYALWYHHFSGKSKELDAEVMQIARQGLKVTNETTEYLYEKYIDDAALDLEGISDSKNVLTEVLTALGSFKAKTESHNERLGKQTDKLSAHVEKAGIQDLLGEVVSQLRDIHVSGVDFHKKLGESQSEIQTLRKKLQDAENESRNDFLTGVYNRRALDEALIREVDLAERYIKDFSVLMIDIDHFKPFNDKWGHQMGDEVLKVVSQAITRSVRGKDFVARYGGEEFAVLLPETPVSGARVVAENIRQAIANAKLQRKDSHESIGKITVSIGVARYRVGEGDTVPFLIKRADDALYAAKNGGRNRVVSEL